MDVTLAIKKHRAKLEQMILDNKDYKYRNEGNYGGR